MMKTNIPEYIKFEQAKSQDLNINGLLPIKALPRLLDALPHGGSDVHVEIHSDIDVNKRLVLNTQFKVSAGLDCQRCMDAYQHPIVSQLQFLPIFNEEQMELLAPEQEPLLLEDGKINLFKMIEDELLLSLPIIPLHPSADCSVKLETISPKASQFDILATLKN